MAKTIYNANGATIDYVKSMFGVRYAYALELGPGRDNSYIGFLLPQSRIAETVKECFIGLFTVFDAIAREE